MDDLLLENPVWSALASSQAAYALRQGAVLRFPAQIAPFVAVASPDGADPADLLALVQPGETVDFVGVAPRLNADWSVLEYEVIAQMHAQSELAVADGPDIVSLDSSAATAMLALTRQVYPGYFRARTRELGDYIGIFAGDELVAMAGERLRIGCWQEISAVCTHPAHLGRGHARRLVATLVNTILRRGQRPFLHVSLQNTRAIAVYQSLGFVTERNIGLTLARRD